MKTDLSILVPSLADRLGTYSFELLRDLTAQIGKRTNVELLVLSDNQRRSVGSKRNDLLRLARGNYVAMVDDDDMVSEDYIASLLVAIRHRPAPDLVVFDSRIYLDGSPSTVYHFGIEFAGHEDAEHRLPCGKMCWRRKVALATPYPCKSMGEDSRWDAQAWKHVKRQLRINRVLYHYYNRSTNYDCWNAERMMLA